MEKKPKTKSFAILATFIIILLATSYFFIKKNPWNITNQIKNKIVSLFAKQDHWICVFIHGNFNTGLGLLSLPRILQDNLKGSAYVKLIRKLRKDPFFYQEQPILKRGLIKIEPTFDLLPNGNKFAAYPIMAGYNEIAKTIKPEREILHFYTFGWSGILSLTKRRNDALRLYNALSKELKHYRKMGINPKIRIIAHSHGGNVALNLGTIKESILLLKNKRSKSRLESLEAKGEITESMMNTINYLQKLPQKKEAKFQLGQKYLDYLPSNNKLKINELIMFGTPIQPETSCFSQSSVFKKIFNFYSEQDVIQMMDVLSTKQHYSSQRLENLNDKKNRNSNIFQAKIMVDRNFEMLITTTDANLPWWKKLSLNKIFSSGSKDPTHKDLWFLAWNKEYCQPNFPLKPLPMVILTPLLVDTIEKNSNFNDVDLNVEFNKEEILTSIVEHGKKEAIGHHVSIPTKTVDEIKKKTMAWGPSNLFRHYTYKRIYTALKKELRS